jgi:hypothetical protein
LNNSTIPARKAVVVADLAERLYAYMPEVCWMTENNLAAELGVSRRQIRYAKQYLVETDRVLIQERPNGKRANPVHTIIKVNPIKPVVDSAESWKVDWSLFRDFAAKDLNALPAFEQVELYQEMGLKTIPLHFPKFKRGLTYCSCPSGRNCDRIGKHPAVAWKGLDFSHRQTRSDMRAYWRDKDARFNVGFVVDGFAVVDVDFRHGGQYSFGYLQDEIGELPAGLSVASGNGRHIYVKADSCALANTVGAMGLSGLDVKAEGGLIVAPCSQHASGNEYRWETVGEPEPLPETWAESLQSEKAERAGAKVSPGKLPVRLQPGDVIPEGERNDTLFRFASRERGRGAGYDHILDVITTINETFCEKPLPQSALRSIAKSAAKFETEAEKRARQAA